MTDSVRSADTWKVDDILADVRRMRGETASSADPVDSILAELHGKQPISAVQVRPSSSVSTNRKTAQAATGSNASHAISPLSKSTVLPERPVDRQTEKTADSPIKPTLKPEVKPSVTHPAAAESRRPAPSGKRPNTIFEEIRIQADKLKKDAPAPQPEVLFHREESAEEKTTVLPGPEDRQTGSFPAADSEDDKTRVMSAPPRPRVKPRDVYTGQVPLPGFMTPQERDERWEDELRRSRKERVDNFKLFGQEEDNDPEDEPTREDDLVTITDYSSPVDAPVIQMDLIARSRSIGWRLVGTLLLTAALLALSVGKAAFADAFGTLLSPAGWLLVQAGITVLLMLVNLSTLISGLGGLFRLTVNLDTAVSIALAVSLLHDLIMLILLDPFSSSGLTVYNLAAGTALTANLWGKYLMIGRIKRNFAFVGNDKPKRATVVMEDAKGAAEIGRGISLGQPHVCYEKQTVDLQHYLDHAYVQDPADESAQRLAPYLLIAGLVGGVIAFFSAPDTSLALTWALTAFCAVVCVCVPVVSLLAGNLPLARSCSWLRSRRVLLTGYDAVYDFAETDVLAVNSRDLFPAGTVKLHQLKTFGNQSVDQVLLDAAGLAIMAEGPLASIFEEVIEGQHTILPEVDTLVYEEKMGISGWVSGNRVLIGNRLLMKNHGILLPDEAWERRLCRPGQFPVYLASRGILSALFVVSYLADESIAESLQKAVDSGLGISVYTCDPNITAEAVQQLFGVPSSSVTVMGAAARHAYHECAQPQQKGDASLAHTGGLDSLIDGVRECRRLFRAIRLSKVLQITVWVLGLAASLLLIGMGRLTMLNVWIVLAFQAVSLVIVLALPALFRGE